MEVASNYMFWPLWWPSSGCKSKSVDVINTQRGCHRLKLFKKLVATSSKMSHFCHEWDITSKNING